MSTHGRCLLWLDDDVQEKFAYELYLLEQAGWMVIWERTLRDAAVCLSERRVHAVFLDQNVTDRAGVRNEQLVWGGCRFLYWLRQVPRDAPRPWLHTGEGEPWGDIEPLADNRGVPVAMVSSFHDPEVWRVTLAADPGDVRLKLLSKPIDESEFIAWLRQHGGGDAS